MGVIRLAKRNALSSESKRIAYLESKVATLTTELRELRGGIETLEFLIYLGEKLAPEANEGVSHRRTKTNHAFPKRSSKRFGPCLKIFSEIGRLLLTEGQTMSNKALVRHLVQGGFSRYRDSTTYEYTKVYAAFFRKMKKSTQD